MYFEKNQQIKAKDLELISKELLWLEIMWDQDEVTFKEFVIKGLASFKFYEIRYEESSDEEKIG